MTADQFAALAELLRLRDGPAREAARLVLVDGVKQIDAAAATGISRASTGNAVSRVRRGMELAARAARESST